MAETHLRTHEVPEERWSGTAFRWAENPPEGMWASIVLEIERRGEEWIVTRIDRNREVLAEEETGFREVSGVR